VKKLTPKEVEALVAAGQEIGSVLDEIDLLRTNTQAEFERLLTELAEPQETARGILEDAANAAEVYASERSEKWQEGETGERYMEWLGELRGLADAAAEDVDAPDIADLERPDWVDAISNAQNFAEFEA
jgi:hypothetical protein